MGRHRNRAPHAAAAILNFACEQVGGVRLSGVPCRYVPENRPDDSFFDGMAAQAISRLGEFCLREGGGSRQDGQPRRQRKPEFRAAIHGLLSVKT